jgi:hypothetical protein
MFQQVVPEANLTSIKKKKVLENAILALVEPNLTLILGSYDFILFSFSY